MSNLNRADSVTSVTKLNGSNYRTWSVQIRLLLEQRHVWRMVSDNRPAEPTDTSSTEYLEWEMKEETARSTILLSLEERLQMKYASETDNAAEIWKKLRNDNKSKVKLNVWGIRADLYKTRLGDVKGDSIEKHAARIQQFVDDCNLLRIRTMVRCTRASIPITIKTVQFCNRGDRIRSSHGRHCWRVR